MSFKPNLDQIPYVGAGIGYRRQLRESTVRSREQLDCVEITTEHFLQHPIQMEELQELCKHVVAIPHGLRMSLGSVVPPNREYLRQIKRVCEVSKAPYYSDHLTISEVPGMDIGHLAPVWFSRESLETVINNVNRIQDVLGLPMVVENISYFFDIPGQHMHQTEFFNKLVERTQCGVLMDLANLHTNATNFKFDPIKFMEDMPLDRVIHVHLAGGMWCDALLLDTHSHNVFEETWKLLEALVARSKVRTVIVERDANFPNELDTLLGEVKRAQDILAVKPQALAAVG
jgi:uncharacterized protein (UPF0276 family)